MEDTYIMVGKMCISLLIHVILIALFILLGVLLFGTTNWTAILILALVFTSAFSIAYLFALLCQVDD